MCSQQYLKYLKEYYLTQLENFQTIFFHLQNFQISFFPLFCVVLEKGIALNIHSWTCFKNEKIGLDEPDGIVGTLLMDLSKAYGCVKYELIID